MPASPPKAACDTTARSVLSRAVVECACGDEATCVARCDGGSGAACSDLGACHNLSVSPPFTPDVGKFVEYASRGCALGDPLGCTNLGEAFRTGYGVTLDRERAGEAFERAFDTYRARCDARDGDACAMLARAYETGRGAPADPSRTRPLRERACALGSGTSCMLLAIEARDAGDATAAARWIADACEQSCGIWCPATAADARQGFSPAAAAAVERWRARCDRGEAKTCR